MLFDQEEELLRWYMKGFRNELNQNESLLPKDRFIEKAYQLGKDDALIGDDVSSIDNKSNEEILNQILKS